MLNSNVILAHGKIIQYGHFLIFEQRNSYSMFPILWFSHGNFFTQAASILFLLVKNIVSENHRV